MRRRARVRYRGLVALLLVSCSLVASPSLRAGGGGSSWVWRPSGLVGGGYQNVALATRSSGGYIVGGELSGFHRSSNGGTLWRPSNAGSATHEIGTHIVSLALSRDHRDWVYAAAGAASGGGAFLLSKNDGRTWDFRAKGKDAPRFSSLNPLCGNTPHPRATGKLIVPDDKKTGRIFVGTLNGGVKRSTDRGRTWKTIAIPNAYVRTLVRDPRDGSVLYAGVCQKNGYSGAYRITNARSADPRVQHLGDAPPTVEEFTFVGKRLYAAANAAGVFSVRRNGGVWKELGGNFFSSQSRWAAIAGFPRDRGGHVLYVGGAYGVKDPAGGHRSVAKSTDGGQTWRWLGVKPSSVHARIAGTTTPWWYAVQNPPGAFGGSRFIASQIVVDPRRHERVLVAGRAGVWRSENGGKDWRPVAQGLLTALSNAVAGRGSRMYVGVGDWTLMGSKDHGAHVRRMAPGGGTFGYAVTTATDGTVFVGSGHVRTNTNGNVFSSTDPFNNPWTNLNLPDNRRVAGLAVGTPNGGRVVLAAVQGSGVWRRSGSTWILVASNATIPIKGFRASFAWSPSSSTFVYLAVPGSGLYRSSDGGLNWVRIWNRSALDVAADPRTGGSRIYVQTEDGVYRMNDARVGTVGAGTITTRKLSVKAGPVAVDSLGRVYVAGGGRVPGFYRSTDLGSTWVNRASDLYRQAAFFPVDLAVSDGRFYVALKRNSVVVGRSK